jgi:hypothetical protein
VLQVYGAPVWGVAGLFAIHTWIAAKPYNELSYTVYEVVSVDQCQGPSRLRIEKDLPDRYWYGARPRLFKEFRGEGVDELIKSVVRAAKSYPWPYIYKAFPGPNSNTFTAWIAKMVPKLGLELPFSAIGSGYVDNWSSFIVPETATNGDFTTQRNP